MRLIGIDTPETVDPRQLLDGKTVFLEDDPSQGDVDRYGRALRSVRLADGQLISLDLVAQGYAFEYTYQAQFQQAEHDAREQQCASGRPVPAVVASASRRASAAPATAEPPTIAPAQPMATVAPSNGATITRAPGTARRDARATVAAHTLSGARCSIVVYDTSGPSKAQGLGVKQADEKGNVSWSWMVGTRTTPGSWPVTISCGRESGSTEVVVL